MIQRSGIMVLLTLMATPLLAQERIPESLTNHQDPQITWLDEDGRPTDRETDVEGIVSRWEAIDGGYRVSIFDVETRLTLEGNYPSLDFAEAKPYGDYLYYSEDGWVIQEGHFDEHGQTQGQLIEYFEDGSKRFEATFVDDEVDGPLISFYPSGQKAGVNNYENGQKNGLEQSWNEAGQLISEQYVDNGKLHGLAKRWHDNGQLALQANYERGVRHGERLEYHESGQLYLRQHYDHGERIGTYEQFLPDGTLRRMKRYDDEHELVEHRSYTPDAELQRLYEYEDGEYGTVWKEDKFLTHETMERTRSKEENGIYWELRERIASDGAIIARTEKRRSDDGSWELEERFTRLGEPTYRKEQEDDQRTGRYLRVENNKIEHAHYVDDERHGEYSVTTLDEHPLITGQFQHGEKIGEWREQSRDGILLQLENYADGQLDGSYLSHHANGAVHENGEYTNGARSGQWREYYANGILQEEGMYQDGIRSGLWREYYDNGMPAYICSGYDEQEAPLGYTYHFHENGALERLFNFQGNNNGYGWEYRDGIPYKRYQYENDRLIDTTPAASVPRDEWPQ